MARDRWVYFDEGVTPPSLQDLHKVLADYLGQAGTTSWVEDQKCLYATLPGPPSAACRSVRPEAQHRHWGVETRWFEVSYLPATSPPLLAICTRGQDELTNDLATGFAQVVARQWDGRVVEG